MPYQSSAETEKAIDRRTILKAGALGGLLLSSIGSTVAEAASFAMPRMGSYKIAFRNTHTGETFSGTYRSGSRYLPDAFDKINVVLRDFRTDEMFPIDPRVIDIMYLVHSRTGSKEPFDVLSGYRSAKTNAMLRKASGGVARNSLHMTGQAIDLRLPGFSTRRIRDIGSAIKAGGVGYYPGSDFVHLDTGKIRTW